MGCKHSLQELLALTSVGAATSGDKPECNIRCRRVSTDTPSFIGMIFTVLLMVKWILFLITESRIIEIYHND